jgi:glycosyltransferase involved in cell wall biosynthesis
MKKKLYYIAGIRMPTEKAHGLQIASMCEAFGLAGYDTTLIVPARDNTITDSVYDYYDVEKVFTIRELKVYDFISRLNFLGSFAFILFSAFFSLWVRRYMRRMDDSILYFRGVYNLIFVPRKYNPILELHDIPERPNILWRYLISKPKKIIVITHGLRDDLVKLGRDESSILVAPDAVDVDKFDIAISREEARVRTGLPLDRKIAMYTGHLYAWKGVDTLIEAGRLIPDIDIVIVGGTDELIAEKRRYVTEEGLTNINILGRVKHSEIPFYLKSADVLVLPNSATDVISSRYTSPLKLFEYMASGRPIVASDIPSIREVVDGDMVTFFDADSYSCLSKCIMDELSNENFSLNKAKKAHEKLINSYTWHKRVNFLERSVFTSSA